MRQLTPRQLKDYLPQADPPPLLLDVREPWEYEICRIDGSQLVPMGQIHTVAGTLDPTRELVAICHHGIRSLQVARYLEHMGHARVINLQGGIDAWAREIDPQMPVY